MNQGLEREIILPENMVGTALGEKLQSVPRLIFHLFDQGFSGRLEIYFKEGVPQRVELSQYLKIQGE